jgi:OOP family OmpA-OmpF porin
MKSILKKATILVTGVILGGSAFAQTPDSNYVKPFSGSDAFRTWSIGINAGVLTPYTIFRGKEDFTSPNAQLGYSAYIKDQILPSFGIQATYLGGKISADNSASGLFASYNTKLKYAVDLTGVFTVANISWMHKQGVIQPYLLAGFGVSSYQPTFTSTAGLTTTVDHNINNAYIPVGVGVKINLSRGINLDLGYQVNFVDGDNLDGYNYGTTNDKYSYAHAGLEFALGNKSKPQLATHNPVASMRSEYLMDEERLQLQEDAEKAKNAQLRRDLDATNSNLLATKNALDQTNAKLNQFTMDSDGDGVPDFFDKCPNTPAGVKVDGSGCPLPVNKPDVKIYVTEQDKAIVKEAIKNLEFDFAKATIRDHSLPSLQKVAQLLVEKGFNLKLAGYTDNVGSVSANLKLSKDRAESVKTYLVSQGASASKIQAEGYGKSHPIASNKTDRGRQLNRRVEFSLF